MRKYWLFFFLAFTGLLLLPDATPASAQAEGPIPLPRDCGGVNPPEYLPPACCVYGYVYDADGTVLGGVTVTVEGPGGTRAVVTRPGEFSDEPYFATSLSELPLAATAGDTVTFTVNHNGRSRVLPYQVGAGGQQVDLLLPTALSDTPIYYVCGSDSNRRICRMDSDGSNVVDLRAGYDPDICPVNGRVLYTDGTDVRVLEMDGTYIGNLTSGTSGYNGYNSVNPDWSPDCSEIVYAGHNGTQYVLMRMNADGSNKRILLTPAGSYSDWYPDWSPNGQKIVFNSNRGGNTLVHTVNVDGTGLRFLASGWYPAWSPNGNQVAYVCFQDGGVQDICVINADRTGNYRLVNQQHARSPVWLSPQRIMYTNSGDWGIYTIRIDGTDKFQLTPNTYHRSPTVRPTSLPIATIHTLAPARALRGRDVITFSGLGQDGDELGAQVISYTWESSLDGVLSTQPAFTLTAASLSTGTHVITLTVMDDERDVATATQTLVVTEAVFDADVLILTNRARLAALYSPAEADAVLQKLDDLAQAANGLVLTVEDDPATAAAYADWLAQPTSFTRANRVAEAIHAQIMAQRAHSPDIAYIVIAGDDRVIPFRRILDRTDHPEHLYRELLPESMTGAALAADRYLTDDFYGNYAPLRRNGVLVYLPDMAVGRLIETPQQIIGQIDAFLNNGEIVVENTIVTGYTFLVDSALEMCSALRRDGLVPDCTLINNVWTATQFVNRALNTAREMIAYNGHANHYLIDTPNGAVSSTQVFNRTIAGGALVWTPGCHGALNAPPETPVALDTVEAWVSRGALVVGNTGYGWGFDGSIGLSELLMLNYTRQALAGNATTAGQALMAAKQRYYAEDLELDAYDEKILMQVALYGIPMTRLVTPEAERAAVAAQPVAAAPTRGAYLTGSGYLTVTYTHHTFPQLTDLITATARGIDYTGDTERNAGAPAQPRYVVPLAALPGTRLMPHGVVLRSAAGDSVAGVDPVVMLPVLTGHTNAGDEPVFDANAWFPAEIARVNPAGEHSTLVFSQAQFHGLSQMQRRYTGMDVAVYYNLTDDWEPPQVLTVTGQLAAGDMVTVSVVASDTSGIHAVVVAYTAGDGQWASVDLTPDGDIWRGSFPGNADSQFIPQVVDGAGNVTPFTRDGRYMQPGAVYSPWTVFLPLILRDVSPLRISAPLH